MKTNKNGMRVKTRYNGATTSATIASVGTLVSLHHRTAGRMYCSVFDLNHDSPVQIDEVTPAGFPCSADAFHTIVLSNC